VALEPAPPAWALRQEVTMLDPQYEGYNARYAPGNFELLPEAGPMAFFGGRDQAGNSRTQPGLYFSFSQKLWHLLVLNETAFAAFSAADAPDVNGGSLNAGVDIDIGPFGVAGMAGYAAHNALGMTDGGLSFTGKLRYLIAERIYLGGIFSVSKAEIFQVNSSGQKLNGITNPGFAGLSVIVR
jgi:hypothetical protein